MRRNLVKHHRTQRITFDMVKEATTLTKKPTETPEAHLSRVTHLHLQGKRIATIEGLELCTNLKVLYLYDNAIERIENLDFAPNLQYLQLQNNNIKDIPSMPFPNLLKFYADENAIQHLTGLDRCTKLEELRIAGQRLPDQISLSFDMKSLNAFSRTLYSLDVSGNGIADVSVFFVLRGLRKFLCAHNRISELHDLKDMMSLPYLAEVDLRGNPACNINKYRDHMISASSDALTILDELPVHRHQQIAIRGLMKHRRNIVGMAYIEGQMSLPSGPQNMDMTEFQNAESVDVNRTGMNTAGPMSAGPNNLTNSAPVDL